MFVVTRLGMTRGYMKKSSDLLHAIEKVRLFVHKEGERFRRFPFGSCSHLRLKLYNTDTKRRSLCRRNTLLIGLNNVDVKNLVHRNPLEIVQWLRNTRDASAQVTGTLLCPESPVSPTLSRLIERAVKVIQLAAASSPRWNRYSRNEGGRT